MIYDFYVGTQRAALIPPFVIQRSFSDEGSRCHSAAGKVYVTEILHYTSFRSG